MFLAAFSFLLYYLIYFASALQWTRRGQRLWQKLSIGFMRRVLFIGTFYMGGISVILQSGEIYVADSKNECVDSI